MNEYDERFKELLNRLERIESHLTGNGTPERGVIVRLDRLEQSAKSWLAIITLTAGAAVTALFESIFGFFKGGHK